MTENRAIREIGFPNRNRAERETERERLDRRHAIEGQIADLKDEKTNSTNPAEKASIQKKIDYLIEERVGENAGKTGEGFPTVQEGLVTCPHCGRSHVEDHIREGKVACPVCGLDMTADPVAPVSPEVVPENADPNYRVGEPTQTETDLANARSGVTGVDPVPTQTEVDAAAGLPDSPARKGYPASYYKR